MSQHWPLSSHCCTPRGSTQQYFHKPFQMWVQCYWLQKGFGAQMGIKAQFFLFSPGKHWPGGSADSWVLWGQDHTTVHGWGLALTHRLSKSLHFPRDSVSAQGVPGCPSSLLKPNMPRGTQVLPGQGLDGISHLVDKLEAEDDADW